MSKKQDVLSRLYAKLKPIRDEKGQYVTDHAMVIALITFAAIACLSTVATGVTSAFTSISAKVNSGMTSSSSGNSTSQRVPGNNVPGSSSH